MSVHRTRKRRRHDEPAYVAVPPAAPAAEVELQPGETPPATPRDLWAALDAITKPTSSRLRRDDGATERVSLPSLWEQLVEAIDSGAGEHNGGGQQSKAPCDSSALSLTVSIATDVRDGCFDLGITRSRQVPKDLRKIVAAINRGRDQVAMDTTLATLRSWAAQIRSTISNDPNRTWRMHGAACRVCSSTSVPTWDDEGNVSRQPALVVHSDRGVISKVECAFCGTVLAGDDLTQLIRSILSLPFRRFTPHPDVHLHAATRPRLAGDTPAESAPERPIDVRDVV